MIFKLIVTSILIGIVTGFFIVIYSLFTKFLSFILFLGDPYETISTLPVWYLYLIPFISIVIINYLISKNHTVKEYGVSEIATAVEENKILFTLKDLILKIFASALSIASGFAVGNEGPSAAIGAMIAQKFHNLIKLPKNMLKISLSIGASSGIAAIFVSPITGIMFAIENIAYEFVKNFSSYLILGSIISFSIAWHFLEPLIFTYSTGKFLEYKYIFASFIFIPIITLFIYFYLALKDIVLNFLKNKLPYSQKNFYMAAIGSLVIGTILLISPYAAFSGHEVVKILINDYGHFPLYMIFILIVLRIIATSTSLYANAVGGLFIALMSIGALVGYGFAEFMNLFNYKIEPFYFAAIGAAVFMGVNMRLPLTAVVLALEITYDYNVIVPTAISVVLVTFITTLKFDIKKASAKKGLK
ncbi:putative chloride channel protein [Nautilia profundicola AmH]|uniref:Chloride channel protein n=1 Tax=Nautilia profundicola (strain ATCC BAA-1463 / DSM 18972 / AmH) TaxID=598659 RepID=B9L8Z2_NAUPA|nr:chloride channel protein [Nautilia profundicola]ACM93212.1 putative chloride channel protein [Nautilia profundicola AmH]